jgi:hypothetical protein
MAKKKRNIAAIYEVDDQNFMNIMGGPHYNIVDVNEDEVIATVWIDDDVHKCEKDALLLSAAEDLLKASEAALDWVHAQDEDQLPPWAVRLAKAVKKANEGDKHTQVFYD